MLRLEHITKKYGDLYVLNDFSIELKAGDFYGIMGENGAGKTTLMKIAACLAQPDSGNIFVDNINAMKNPYAARNHIGYVPDNFGLYESLTVSEYMEFYASTYGLTGLKARKIYMDILEEFRLTGKLDAYVDTLSKGMKQRLCMARALIHNPDILILDEPFTGIDGEIRKDINDICLKMVKNGKTVLFSSHQFSDMQILCNQFGILKDGKLKVSGTIAEINEKVKLSTTIIIKLLPEDMPAGDTGLMREKSEYRRLLNVLRQNPKISSISQRNAECQIRGSFSPEDEAKLLKALISQNFQVTTFAHRDNDLEQVFEKVMSGRKNM